MRLFKTTLCRSLIVIGALSTPSIHAACPTAAPTLSSPSHQDVLLDPFVSFEWSSTAADGFRLVVDDVTGSPSNVVDDGTIDANTTTFETTLYPGDFEWYVEALGDPNSCDPTSYQSSPLGFSIIECPTLGPPLLEPVFGVAVDSPVYFDWDDDPDADGYTLNIGDANENPLFTRSTAGSEITEPLDPGDYSWWITTNYANGCDPTVTGPEFFTVCGSTPPGLTFPADNATLTGPIIFTWSSVTDATDYTLLIEFDNNPDTFYFIDSFAGTSSQNATHPNGIYFPEGGTFNWWVEANFVDCPSASSSSRFLTAEASGGECPTLTPETVSPSNSATVNSPVQFEWLASLGADGYILHLDRFDVVDSFSFDVGDTLTTSQALDDGSYTWYVEAYTTGCDSLFSTTPSTLIVGTGGATCPTAGPALFLPAFNDVVASPVDFEWDNVEGATSYILHIFNQNEVEVFSDSFFDVFATVDLESGFYDWSVEATFAGCDPVSSDLFAFQVEGDAGCLEGPALIEPFPGAIQASPVNFFWSAVQGATQYDLYVFDSSDNQAFADSFSDVFATVNLPDGDYDWFVNAIHPTCGEIPSDVSFFTISSVGSGECPSFGPYLFEPSPNTITPSPVTFEWESIPGAAQYDLHILDDFGDEYFVDSFFDTFTTLSLPEGDYEWYVIAQVPGCGEYGSETTPFTVAGEAGCPTSGPRLLFPEDQESVASPVFFEWSPIASADFYYLSIFEGTALFFELPTSDSWAVVDLPSGDYRWSVESVSSSCPVVVSAESRVRVFGEGSACPDLGPVLLSPGFGEPVGSPVLLEWSAVDGATEYEVSVYSQDGELFGGRTSNTSLSLELPLGEYDWFVEVSFLDCPPSYSEFWYFSVSCNRGAPSLVSPTDDSDVSSPVTFQWTPVASANGYNLIIFWEGNYYIDEIVSGTSATYDLPTGYVDWTVASVFGDDCPPEYSDFGFFYAEGDFSCESDEPSLVAPAEDATVSGSPTVFRWSEVEGAYGYWVILSSDFEEFDIIAETDVTSVSANLPPGEYVWFVVALLDECPWLESDVSFFNVEEGSGCSEEEPELVTPIDGQTVATPITLSWETVQDAFEYEVFVEPFDGAPTLAGATTSTSFVIDSIPPGDYFWYVVGHIRNCFPTYSEGFVFTVRFDEACDNHDAPYLLEPPDGASRVPSPIGFEWTPVPDATSYQVWASISGAEFQQVGSEVTVPQALIAMPEGRVDWFVEAQFDACPSTFAEPGSFGATVRSTECTIASRPTLVVPGSAASDETYVVFWSALAKASKYEIQEAPTPEFRNAVSREVNGTEAAFTHMASTETRYFYRVRGIDSCASPGPFSLQGVVVVVPPDPSTGNQFGLTNPFGDLDPVKQKIFIPGSSSKWYPPPQVTDGGRRRPVKRPAQGPQFTATSSSSWVTITPSSGTLPPGGATVTATVNPETLPPGTSTATVTVKTTGSNPMSLPVSVSLVTPVASGTASGMAPSSLVLPILSHSSSSAGQIASNVAIANLSTEAQKYLLTFTPTGVNGTQSGKQTSIQLEAKQTTELDDILGLWFGSAGSTTSSGMLEIRPLDTSATTSASTRTTVASATIVSSSVSGSLATFVPPIQGSRFVGKSTQASDNKFVVGNINQSQTQTTEFGILEGDGKDATVKVAVYDAANNKAFEQEVTLKPREQKILTNLLSGLTVVGGRAEIEVTSDTGRVAAFAQTVDTRTGDRSLLNARRLSAIPGGQYVIPGATNRSATGGTRKTDLWLHNPASAAVTATVTYYPAGSSGTPSSQTVSLQPGQSKTLSNVVQSTFGKSNSSGAIQITTPSGEKLVASASTYLESSNGGRQGSLLPAVTANRAVAKDQPSLQMLQLERSSKATTDLGVAELSGNPATVRVTAILPGSLAAATVDFALQANEYRSFVDILSQLGASNVRNGRLTVKVTGGTGKVTAFACIVDRGSGDETLILAQ